MPNLIYPPVLDKSPNAKVLADISLRLENIDFTNLSTLFLNLTDDKFLDILAEAKSVEGFDGLFLAKTPKEKKEIIKASLELHRRKGTPFSIREILRKLGFGEVILIEGLSNVKRNKTIKRNAAAMRGDDKSWAYYSIEFNRRISKQDAIFIREVLRNYAPTRSVLASMVFEKHNILRNGTYTRNGEYSRGESGL